MPLTTEGSTPSNSTMTEKPANKVRGFFLYSPFDEDQFFFRVYGEADPATGRKTFTDYKVCAEDVEVTIESGALSFYEIEHGENRLDWSSEYLGEKKDVQS